MCWQHGILCDGMRVQISADAGPRGARHVSDENGLLFGLHTTLWLP